MNIRSVATQATFALPLMLALAVSATGAHADSSAATACAAKLTPDAKVIFDKTLPQVTSNSDLRSLLTTNTRSLAMAGTISRGSARDSATAAGKCLQQVKG